ncbi:MAG: hypothetical protein GYA60_03380 [Candidatus Methanofastidiosa archaeon]|nr:hypothetical protein [Candidatus Methanofastidiosa archaeon]
MRKKIVLFLSAILLLSLIGASANGIRLSWNPGDPYIPCYPFEQTYNYPTTTIPASQNGLSTVSFDIPSNPCPPVKIIQIGRKAVAQHQLDADSAILDQNTPTFQYQCSLSSDQGCCVFPNGGNYIDVCPNRGTISVTTYDTQGVITTYGPSEECLYVLLYDGQSGRTATRFVITNNG